MSKITESEINVGIYSLAELCLQDAVIRKQSRSQATTSLTVSENAFAVVIDDDSMDPVAPKGSTLIFDSIERVGQALMFAAVSDSRSDKVFIKHVKKSNDKYFICSDDASSAAEIKVSQILGGVIQIQRHRAV